MASRLIGNSSIQDEVVPAPVVSSYTPPAYDHGRLEQLTQELASPNIRRLRSGLRESFMSAQSADNPAVRAMLMRRSLEGYGQGLESAVAGGRSGALSAYAQEYGPQVDAARLAWSEQVMRERLKWQNEQTALDRQTQTQSRLDSAPRTNSISFLSHDPLASVRNTAPSTSGYWGGMYMNTYGGGGTSAPSTMNSADPLGLLG